MPRLALLTAHGGPIELAEFPLTTPAPGTAALQLRMAGICGSDLHIFRGELPLFYPFAMGHEMVCEIYTTRRQPLYKVPEELTDEAVAPLNCALAQVLFALRDVRLGDTVVIQGAGGLGINAAAVAHTAGAAEVIVIDKIAERLDVASDFGATHCIDAGDIST